MKFPPVFLLYLTSKRIYIDFVRNIWYNVEYGGDGMIKIAVCDDFKDIVAQVNEYLVEYQQLRDAKLDIKNFLMQMICWII